MLLAFILVAVATLLLCWLCFTLAALALPLFVGVTVAQWAHHGGTGVPAVLLLGLTAGAATLFVGQFSLAFAKSPGARLGVALMFVAPAGVAGYSAAHGLASLCVASPSWQILFGVGGAIGVSLSAFARLTSVLPQAAVESLTFEPLTDRT